MSVVVKDAAKSVVSANVEAHDLLWIDHRLGQRAQWRGLPEGPMGPMPVVELLELAQRVEEVAFVPDQSTVEELARAGLHPPFHD